jgi:acetoin utilization deacetylase AcuC-like enzyme
MDDNVIVYRLCRHCVSRRGRTLCFHSPFFILYGRFAVSTAFITHPSFLLHEMGADHPECPERLTAIHDRLLAAGLDGHLARHEAPAATREQVLRAHGPDYLDQLEAASPTEGLAYLDPDTALNPQSLTAAWHAAGALIKATDLVIGGECANAFCAVRPPGHHAVRERAMGFCIFNSVAVGILHALETHGLERIAVIDFDVHHGNGTEEIFAGDERVRMMSTFQHPLYPYSGAEPLGDNMFNVPLPPGSDGAKFRQAVEDVWLPALEDFQPQMIYISAGFDAHREDPLAGLAFVEADYAWVTRELMRVAARHAQGRIVSTLEGGYALSALGRSVAEHVRELVTYGGGTA